MNAIILGDSGTALIYTSEDLKYSNHFYLMTTRDYKKISVPPHVFHHHLLNTVKYKHLKRCSLHQIRRELNLGEIHSQISALSRLVCSFDEDEGIRKEAADCIRDLLQDAERAIETDNKLLDIAEDYRRQGLDVHLHPHPNQLPEFARDFVIEILALGEQQSILASVKASRKDLSPDSAALAGAIEDQEGWRYDLHIVLGDNMN